MGGYVEFTPDLLNGCKLYASRLGASTGNADRGRLLELVNLTRTERGSDGKAFSVF